MNAQNQQTDPTPLDDLSTKILHSLHVDGRASWSQVAQEVDSSTSTVRRRYQTLEQSGRLRVVGRTDVSVLGSTLTAVVQLRGPDVGTEPFVESIQRRPEMRYLGSVLGSSDGIAELVVQSPAELHAALGEVTRKFEVEAEPFVIAHTHTMGLDWVPEGTPKPRDLGTRKIKADLSASEGTVLGLLMRNGRISLGELGAAIGKSETTARRVMESLKARDILSFRVLVEPIRLGFQAEYWMWLDVEPSQRASVGKTLSVHPATKFLAATSGRYGVVGQVVLRSTRELYGYMTELLGDIPGIRGVEMMMMVETHKRMWHPVENAAYGNVLGPDWLFSSDERLESQKTSEDVTQISVAPPIRPSRSTLNMQEKL